MGTTRRHVIQGAASAAALLWMPAGAARALAQADDSDVAPLRSKFLYTPDFARLRKTARFAAGVRPHRTGGVRLSLEEFKTPNGTKFLIHNYGHGGAGITLSWGCASVVRDHVETVVDQMRGTKTRPLVGILGAGVIGLTVAAELRRKWPALPITIYARTLDVRRTVSFIAAGQFEPSQVWREYRTPDRKPILDDYVRRSAARIREIEASGRRLAYGVAQRQNYTLDHPQPSLDEHTPRDVVPAFRRGRLPFANLDEVGREYQTWLVNPRMLMPRLVADLRNCGVRFVAREFQNVGQVDGLTENIVINCTGYGAKTLFDDPAVTARRGHIVILGNPAGLKYFFSGGCDNAISYCFARQRDIIVGGTIIRDDERDYFDRNDSEDTAICNRLLDNVENVFAGRPDACVDAA